MKVLLILILNLLIHNNFPYTTAELFKQEYNLEVSVVTAHRIGLTEIAGQDNEGQPNLQGLTLQDRTMTDNLAGSDIARQDNDGQTSRAWHCRTN